MIYEFGIHNSIEAAISGGCSMPPVYFGAVALVHTSSGIRKESRNAMRAIASRQWRNDPETQVEGFFRNVPCVDGFGGASFDQNIALVI